MVKIDLAADDLFGNEAAEDEQPEIFESYAYQRPEIAKFCNPLVPINVVMAFKGEGKSALMRIGKATVLREDETALAIDTTAYDLSPALNTENFDEWVRAWKKQVLELIASEIGARSGHALNRPGIPGGSKS